MTATLRLLNYSLEGKWLNARLDVDGESYEYNVGLPPKGRDPAFHALQVIANTLAMQRRNPAPSEQDIAGLDAVTGQDIDVSEDWATLFAAVQERSSIEANPLIRILVDKGVLDENDVRTLKLHAEEM